MIRHHLGQEVKLQGEWEERDSYLLFQLKEFIRAEVALV